MVALLSFKKKENEYEPTSNVKKHKNHQKSQSPKTQKPKNPKIQSFLGDCPENFGFLDFWIFGYLDVWMFGYLDFWIFGFWDFYA